MLRPEKGVGWLLPAQLLPCHSGSPPLLRRAQLELLGTGGRLEGRRQPAGGGGVETVKRRQSSEVAWSGHGLDLY